MGISTTFYSHCSLLLHSINSPPCYHDYNKGIRHSRYRSCKCTPSPCIAEIRFELIKKSPIVLTISPHLLIQGIDDALAMFYLLMNPKVKLTAVTLTHGNTNIDHVKRNAETVLHVMRKQREYLKQEVPVEELPVLAIGMEWIHMDEGVVCVCVFVCGVYVVGV